MKKFSINTKRTSFFLWEPGDITAAKKIWLDPDVSKYISAKGVFSEKEVESRLLLEVENQRKYGVQYWPFADNDTNELIGCCGFRPYRDSGLEFGVHIRAKFWRKGFGTEAGAAAIAHCLEVLRPRTIMAGHNPKNTGSKQLLSGLGFVFSHYEYYEPTGLEHPTYIYLPH